MKQIDYNGMDTKIEKKSRFSKKMDDISRQFILYECK